MLDEKSVEGVPTITGISNGVNVQNSCTSVYNQTEIEKGYVCR